MSASSNILLQKLDEFIRKYYKNQLIRGLLYTTGLLIGMFLLVILAEYFAEFGTTIRTILFYSLLGAALLVTGKLILWPLLKLNRFGTLISHEQAASIIGNHFSSVQDKLLNLLQLQKQQAHLGSNDLLIAGINQKISELQPVPFSSAIDLSDNKRYLKYALPPMALALALFLIWPQIITQSTDRLVHHQTYFEKTAPFRFLIDNKELKALQQQDYTLHVKLQGNELPNEVFIAIDGNEFKLEKESNSSFSYTFKNLQKTTPFELNAAGFSSKPYELSVLPRPMLLKFDVVLKYPAYLGRKDEVLSNTGDLLIPQGTLIGWQFNTQNAEKVWLQFNDSTIGLQPSGEGAFSFRRRMLQSSSYSIKTTNHFVSSGADSVNYNINVIPDQFPAIEVSEKVDSLNPKNIYFSGSIKDDYGFSQLIFHYTVFSKDSIGRDKEQKGESVLGINKAQVSQPYFHFLDASRFQLQPGDRIEYYFEVWDNDGIHGAKASKTGTMAFKAPSLEEIQQTTDKNNDAIKNDLDESIKKAKQLQKDINDMSRKMADKKQLGWEEKKKLEELINKQNELKNKIEQTRQENLKNNEQKNEFTQPDESLLEKQKELEKLFENIMTPEMKKLFDELNKLLDKMDKNQVQQKLDELKLNNKDLEKELDRTLENFKQLEVEQRLQQAIDKLDDLSKKQDQLSKESENKQADNKALEQKQNELNKKFDDLKKDMKELEQKNSELEQPNDLPKTEEQKNQISQEMENSSQQLNNNNKKNAAKSQKQAAAKMQDMKQGMQQAMQNMQSQQEEENMQTLRQILENLLHLSFAQEALMDDVTKTKTDNPQYIQIPKQQKKLQEDSKVIEDSLLALSKRAPQISALVNREISAIHMNMGKAVEALAERQGGEAQQRMQYSMTSINNLALLLNESLEQMQQQAQQKPGNGGSCNKPGAKPGGKPGAKPSMATMRQMQQQLNQQLQQLKDALEKGQKPGEKPGQGEGRKPGQKPGSMGGAGQGGNGNPGLSEQLAKMAAQQEAIRRQMQQMMNQMQKEGGNNPGGNMAEMMEQTEKDIVNKAITQETMKRQEQILTRLLESEKAEREREQDEQRKSNEAKTQTYSNPAEFLEYKRLKEKEMELLNTVPPSLTPYYKDKVNNYFNNVSK